jgi:hypothetical protein
VSIQDDQWIESRAVEFQARTGSAQSFLPELKRAFLDLTAHEPFLSRVKVNVAEEDPSLLTVNAGLFELKFAADFLSDTVFYAFASSTLKKLVPRESAIFHHGVLKLSKGPWGVMDNPGVDVHKTFIAEPQSVQYFPLADQVARWSLEQLLGGYPSIAALEESTIAAAKAREEAAKKEAKGGSRV